MKRTVAYIRLIACILLSLFTSISFAQDRILILGDSLSAAHNINPKSGWVHLLAQSTYLENWEVINASTSGATLANGINTLPRLVKKHQPKAIIVELGANDGLQGKPHQYIKKNLSTLVKIAKKHNIQHIFLIGMVLPNNYGMSYTQKFVSLFQEVATEEQIHLISFVETNILGNPELLLEDGIHPNENAQPLIKDIVLNAIRPILN